jgi:hypothetical protein
LTIDQKFFIVNCWAIKTFFYPQWFGNPNLFSIGGNNCFQSLATKFFPPFVIMHRVRQKLSKKYYMPPFQIQLLMIEKFRLPSNNPNFLDGKQNPYLVAIHMAIKNFWSPTIW